MKKSESIAALSAALAKAQGEITGAKKDADNPYFKSHYADLQSVWEAIREPLSSNGLAVIQLPGRSGDEGGLFVETILSHESGEWISGTLAITPVKDDPQGIGSAITYARRYALQSIAGVAPMDDDGEAAMGRSGQEQAANGFEEGHLTNDPVPSTYWDIKKKSGMEAANAWLSRSYDGAKMGVRKTDSGWTVVSYGGEIETKPANAKPVENSESAATGSWKDVICTFGKKNGPLRGHKLGELNDDSLKYLADLFLADGKEIKQGDRKMVAGLAIWQGSHRKVSQPEKSDDLPKFNGPNHEALFENITWANITPVDFIEAMKLAKIIPESAKSFDAMSDETALSIMSDFENAEQLVRQYMDAKPVPK